MFEFFFSIASGFTTILVNSPFYPHWLNNLKSKQLEREVLTNIFGTVLEVGAGDTKKKHQILNLNHKIKKYIVTDYSSWDNEFNKINETVSKFGEIGAKIFGFNKRGNLDLVCDAMFLPFNKEKFDFHLSFEVLEHISNPFKFFSEATRVLKKNGKIILSVPVFYRVHGIGQNHDFDYFRYMPGFFHEMAKLNGLTVQKVYFNTGVGTTLAQLMNQFLIEKIRKGNYLLKLFLLVLAIFIFPITNILGYLLDLFPDIRFSNRYFVILKKN